MTHKGTKRPLCVRELFLFSSTGPTNVHVFFLSLSAWQSSPSSSSYILEEVLHFDLCHLLISALVLNFWTKLLHKYETRDKRKDSDTSPLFILFHPSTFHLRPNYPAHLLCVHVCFRMCVFPCIPEGVSTSECVRTCLTSTFHHSGCSKKALCLFVQCKAPARALHRRSPISPPGNNTPLECLEFYTTRISSSLSVVSGLHACHSLTVWA